jgi:hypothetical protein
MPITYNTFYLSKNPYFSRFSGVFTSFIICALILLDRYLLEEKANRK